MQPDPRPLVPAGPCLWLAFAMAVGLAVVGLANGQTPETAIGRALVALVILACLLRLAVGLSVPAAAVAALPAVEDIEKSGTLVPATVEVSAVAGIDDDDDGEGTEQPE